MGEMREDSGQVRKASESAADNNLSQKQRQDFHNLRFFAETYPGPL